jgi:hypothetical protein
MMTAALDNPPLVLLVSFAVFWSAALIGRWLGKARKQDEGEQDFSFVLGGTLTLLGLILGFTFSMAVGRYDQRKNYEEQEANAIGTEYVRADVMPPASADAVRALLQSYLHQRIRYYQPLDDQQLRQLDVETARLQAQMWSEVASYASAAPTPVAAVVMTGMNDVLNSQGYTQAAWWNRIPRGAWLLMFGIAVFCNFLLGYGSHGERAIHLLILPIALAVTLFLIADIDSPRGGVIRVSPQNLQAVAQSIRDP